MHNISTFILYKYCAPIVHKIVRKTFLEISGVQKGTFLTRISTFYLGTYALLHTIHSLKPFQKINKQFSTIAWFFPLRQLGMRQTRTFLWTSLLGLTAGTVSTGGVKKGGGGHIPFLAIPNHLPFTKTIDQRGQGEGCSRQTMVLKLSVFGSLCLSADEDGWPGGGGRWGGSVTVPA
jgi:hypothetical protein